MKRSFLVLKTIYYSFFLLGMLVLGRNGHTQKGTRLPKRQQSHIIDCTKTNFPKECQSLVQLYQSNQIRFQMKTPDVCTWQEVRCNDEKTEVITFYLSRKNLKVLPENVFAGLRNLQILWFSGNQLKVLPEGVFKGLPKLQVLYLDGNRLSVLPDRLFSGLTNLQELRLYSNQLKVLPEDVFMDLAKLKELDLHSNQLSTLPEKVFTGLSSLKNLWLSENPFPVDFKLSATLCQQVSITPKILCP